MHNMTWLHASLARQKLLTSSDERLHTPQILMSAESVGNFDQLVGTLSLDALVPILRAQILSLQGRAGDALVLYDEHLASAMAQGLARMQASLRADMAWCRLRLGQATRAQQDARAAARAVQDESDLDDRAAAHSRLSQVFTELDEPDAAAFHAQRAAADWQAHAKAQASAVALLDGVLESLPA